MNKGIINDRRAERTDKPGYYLVATDKFMSGWGQAPDKSYVAFPVYADTDYQHVGELERWMHKREDWIRVRTNSNLPRVQEGQHCSVYDLPSIEELRRRMRDM